MDWRQRRVTTAFAAACLIQVFGGWRLVSAFILNTVRYSIRETTILANLLAAGSTRPLNYSLVRTNVILEQFKAVAHANSQAN
jgi:hypothetical protein